MPDNYKYSASELLGTETAAATASIPLQQIDYIARRRKFISSLKSLDPEADIDEGKLAVIVADPAQLDELVKYVNGLNPKFTATGEQFAGALGYRAKEFAVVKDANGASSVSGAEADYKPIMATEAIVRADFENGSNRSEPRNMMYAEILLLLLIVGRQVWIFLQNRRLIARVEALYPAADALDIERVTLQVPRQSGEGGFEVTEIDLLENAPTASAEFQQIRTDTNEYLTNNKGAAADFSLLRDISERHAEALDEEVQAQIAAPLYWGLVGTFGGAILGLIPLFVALDADKLTSPTVSEFLGGVLIAMVGSLCGLMFTLWGNQLLKTARAHRDKLKNAYYTFLQVRLLPKLNSDMQKSMGDMKAVLDTFNEKFFTRIQNDFFAKLSQILPLMTQMGEFVTKTSDNIAVQRDFLVKLEEVGVTKMANATIKVFDRVDQSAATFEKFMGYQTALNQTLEAGKDVTELVFDLLERLSAIEQAAGQMPAYLSKHDETLNNVLRLLIEHQSTLKTASSQMAAEIGKGADRMRGQLDHNLEELDAQAKAAHQRYQAWFERLTNDNVFEKIVQYLDPIKAIPAQQMELNKLQEKQSQLVARALTQLETRLDQQSGTQEALVRQVAVLAELLSYQSQPWHRRLSGFKPNGQPTR